MNWTHTLRALEGGKTDSLDLELAAIEAARAIAEQLEILAGSLPIPYVPVERSPENPLEPLVIGTPERENSLLHQALELLREVLDAPELDSPGGDLGRRVDQLFAAEELLARELGNPIWEGRSS